MARYEVIFEATGDGLILMDTQYPVENGKTLDAEVADFSETDAGERAAACLNALEGIPDPAAFVEAAKAVVQADIDWASSHATRVEEYMNFVGHKVDALAVTMQARDNTGKAVG